MNMQMVIDVHIRRSKLETVLLVLHVGGPEVQRKKMHHYVHGVLSSQKKIIFKKLLFY